jgi:hypothetical protein
MPYTTATAKAEYMRRFRAHQKAKRVLLATVPTPAATMDKAKLLLDAARTLGNDRVRRGDNFVEAVDYVQRVTGLTLRSH